MKKIILLISTIFFSIGVQSITNIDPIEKPIQISKDYSRYFIEKTGNTWIPIMINYLPRQQAANDDEAFAEIERYFKNFSSNGGNALRIWISTPFLEIEDTEEGVYNPLKFERIDKMLALAEKYGILIKFTLQHITTISSSNKWSNSAVLAKNYKNIREYANTPKGLASYLKRAKALSDRYKNNEQIYSWELWNEVDGMIDADWMGFSNSAIDAVTELFPNHLVVQTVGSLDSEFSETTKYPNYFEIKNNDFISVHRYLDLGDKWQQYEKIRIPMDELAAYGVDFSYKRVPNKPIVVNEIGAVQPSHIGPSELYPVDKEGLLLHDMIFAPFFAGAAGSGGAWHWDSYIDKNNLWYHFKRFNNAINKVDPIKEKFVPFFFEYSGLKWYVLQGENKTLVWLRDAANNWKSELENGTKPQTISNVHINIEKIQTTSRKKYSVYDPWKDAWVKAAMISSGEIEIPEFSRSVVILLEN